MKILAVSPVFPYPANDGDKLRIYNMLKELKKEYRIHLVCFALPGEENFASKLKHICEKTTCVGITKKKVLAGALRGIFGKDPINIRAYRNSEMERAVKRVCAQFEPDAFFAYRLRGAQYAEMCGVRGVVDIVDSLALHAERKIRYERNIFKLIYLFLDKNRLKRYEQGLEKRFYKVLVNSEEDGEYLGIKNCVAAPNGADFGSAGKRPAKKKNSFTAGFFGNMKYHPNKDGINWFLKNVWEPKDEYRLVIAGNESREYAGVKGAMAAGYLEDLNKEIANWDVSIVPVRYGTGRQNKILQSWAAGVPVIATSFAAAGVYGRNEKNLLTADTPIEFRQAMEKLKNNKKLGMKISAGGRRTLKKHFDWIKTGVIIRDIYSKIKAAGKGRKK
ncbi:MAG: glycosyltransferase [Candidatus Goldiibacteriota bacterium]